MTCLIRHADNGFYEIRKVWAQFAWSDWGRTMRTMRSCVPVTNGVFISRDDYGEDKLPMHPCFQLVANSEQVLTTYTSRRLLTLEKLQEPKVKYYTNLRFISIYFVSVFKCLTVCYQAWHVSSVADIRQPFAGDTTIYYSSYNKSQQDALLSKSKGVPWQAEVALGVLGRLRPQIISAFGTTSVVGHQPYASAAFFQRLSWPQGTWFCRKEQRKKSPVTPPGVDPGTVQLVAQCLNHYTTPGPRCTISQRYFGKELYMFWTDLLSIIRSLNTVFTAVKKVKAVCGPYSTAALRHIVLLPEWVHSFISRGAAHTERRERPLLAKEGTIPGI